MSSEEDQEVLWFFYLDDLFCKGYNFLKTLMSCTVYVNNCSLMATQRVQYQLYYFPVTNSPGFNERVGEKWNEKENKTEELSISRNFFGGLFTMEYRLDSVVTRAELNPKRDKFFGNFFSWYKIRGGFFFKSYL